MAPRVSLISFTPFPLETMYAFWHGSRVDAPPLTAQEVHGAYISSKKMGERPAPRFYVGPSTADKEPFHQYFDREIESILGLDFPLKETIGFAFAFDNVTITWREQAVRDRDATPWSQTSRTRPLENFADQGWYEEPEAIYSRPRLHDEYREIVFKIQNFYRMALAEGVNREDARCLQPTSQTHRISFHYDGRTLERATEKRLCFIAQSELWAPVLTQMKDLLVGIDRRLAVLFHPPCVKGGQFRHCPYEHENERRMDGRDPYGPCPLWYKHNQERGWGVDIAEWGQVPHQANAEEQFARIAPLWPINISGPVAQMIELAKL